MRDRLKKASILESFSSTLLPLFINIKFAYCLTLVFV